MKTTLNLRDDLIHQAAKLSRIKEKTALVHAGLEALIAKHTRERLAALGGTEKKIRPVSRRRIKLAIKN